MFGSPEVKVLYGNWVSSSLSSFPTSSLPFLSPRSQTLRAPKLSVSVPFVLFCAPIFESEFHLHPCSLACICYALTQAVDSTIEIPRPLQGPFPFSPSCYENTGLSPFMLCLRVLGSRMQENECGERTWADAGSLDLGHKEEHFRTREPQLLVARNEDAIICTLTDSPTVNKDFGHWSQL